MMEVQVPIVLEARGGVPTADDVDTLLGMVMDEMIAPDGYDIDYSATLSDLRVVFTAFTDEVGDPDLNGIWAAVRAALHGAGVATPGWELAQASWVADMRKIELVTA
jgi:hypothetical protein